MSIPTLALAGACLRNAALYTRGFCGSSGSSGILINQCLAHINSPYYRLCTCGEHRRFVTGSTCLCWAQCTVCMVLLDTVLILSLCPSAGLPGKIKSRPTYTSVPMSDKPDKVQPPKSGGDTGPAPTTHTGGTGHLPQVQGDHNPPHDQGDVGPHGGHPHQPDQQGPPSP